MTGGEHVNCEHDPEGADGNPFASMICSPTGQSTSAMLRQTQGALAKSQQDLTTALAARDEALAEAERLFEVASQALTERSEARRDLDLARAELVTATAELGQLRGYVASLERALTNADTAHEAEIATLRARPRLPETTNEIRDWYAQRGLNLSCGPGVLFTELRRYLNQETP